MVKGFRDFIMRGNVVDLAVAVVIGTAFARVVDALVRSFLNPLIKVILGGRSASGTFVLRGQTFDWGGFVNAVIAFLLTALAIYLFVVYPLNRLAERRARRAGGRVEELTDEVRLLTEIRDELRADRSPGRPGRP